MTRDFFRLHSCAPVDVTRLAGKGRALTRLVEIRGREHIEAALAAGKGAILCSAHFGNFNCAMSLIGAHGFPITVIGRWASNTVDNSRSPIGRLLSRLVFQKAIARYRRRPNIEPLGQIELAFEVATILRQNELVGIAIDAPLRLPADRARGVTVDFLKGQALLLPGATSIAQLTKAPLLMMFLRRSADWRHQVLEISPPISMDGDALTAFKRCLAVVEAAILQNPAHWTFWNFSDLVALGLLPEEALNSSK